MTSTAERETARRVVLDVGANAGEFALEMARRNPRLQVVAIEPVPSLAEGIRDAASTAGLDTVRVLEVALGAETGESTLNVAELGDWGVSSLLDFDAASLAGDEYWATREDLRFTTTQTVTVRTLGDLLTELDPEVVDFLKIDVQGLDLEVLASAGERLGTIRAGMLEVPAVSRTRLYAQEVSTLRSALSFLAEHDFDVYAVKPNDPATNEVNVYFIRAGEDPAALEEELSLRGLHLYDGKHFWTRPAASLAEASAAEERATAQDERAAQLEGRIAELEERIRTLEPLADPATSPELLRQRVQVLEAELAHYHETLGVPAPASTPGTTTAVAPATTTDLLARWAEAAREVDRLRRATDLLTEKERRAVTALRKAREAADAAVAAEDQLRAEIVDLQHEIRRMRDTIGWRLTEPLRAGRRLLARGPGRGGDGAA